MAVELVGGWFVNGAISKLITELVDCANDHKTKLGLTDELARLDKALPKIQTLVKTIVDGLIRKEISDIEKCLPKLIGAADHADNVMDEMDCYLVRNKVETKNKVSTVKTFLEHVGKKNLTLKKLKKVVRAMDEVAVDIGKFYKLVGGLPDTKHEAVNLTNRNSRIGSLLNMETKVYGRDKVKQDVIDKLLNPTCKKKEMNFTIVPIIGEGGARKTTLAQLVYNDPKVKEHFELRIWVQVSNNFDVVSLIRKLYESVFAQKAEFDNFNLIQTILIEKLQSKRFLVVFDDVWNDINKDGWEKLVAPLKSGSTGSTILLTTRMTTVATLIGSDQMDSVFLEKLNEHNLRDHSKKCKFGDEDPSSHKQPPIKIERLIAEKLGMSSLEEKILGESLHFRRKLTDDTEYWRSILEQPDWWSEQEPMPLPALKLSYQQLPSHLKACLSFSRYILKVTNNVVNIMPIMIEIDLFFLNYLSFLFYFSFVCNVS